MNAEFSDKSQVQIATKWIKVQLKIHHQSLDSPLRKLFLAVKSGQTIAFPLSQYVPLPNAPGASSFIHNTDFRILALVTENSV